MNNVFSVNNFRAAGMVFKEYLAGVVGGNESDIAISPYVVRVSKPLSATDSNYDFSFANSQTKISSDILLSDSDIIQVYGISVGIQKFDPAAPSFTTTEYFWPDPTVFAVALEAPALELIYNGLFNLWTNNTLRVPNLSTSVFRTAPGGGAFVGPTMEERGYFIPNEYPVLFGNKQNRATISIGAGTKAQIAQTGVTTNNLVLKLLCFKYNGSNTEAGCSL